MRKITKVLAIGGVVAAVGGIGLAAMAETSGPGFGPPFMRGHMGPGMMGPQSGPQAAGFADLAALKAELAIKPEQAAAWDAYVKVVRDTTAQMQAKMDMNAMHGMSSQDRDAFMTTQRDQHDQAFGTVKSAAEALLPSLDDSQKAKARTSLPGLASRGPAMMQHAGMPLMGHGMGMMQGPMGGATR
jgi:hypothetical protein